MADSVLVKHRWSSLSIAALVLLAACGGSKTADVVTTVAAATTAETATTAITATPTTAAATTTLDTLLGIAETGADTSVAVTEATAETLPTPEDPPPPDLSVPRDQIGALSIPDIKIDMPMFEGVSLPTLDKGPGHWPGTAMPGRAGNVVIAGHRVSHNHPFRDIDKLKKGNEVIFTVNGGKYVYLVRETKIVYPDALWIVEQTPGKTATLFACHPKGSTRQRIVVFLDYAPDRSMPVA